MERHYQKTQKYLAAKKRVKEIRGFYIHLLVYIFINLMLFVGANNNHLWESMGRLSSYVIPIFWGLGLLAHWFSLFGPSIFFGKK
ncbi:MAG: 2TM domain-containing protein [Salinimicrobium sp.]